LFVNMRFADALVINFHTSSTTVVRAQNNIFKTGNITDVIFNKKR